MILDSNFVTLRFLEDNIEHICSFSRVQDNAGIKGDVRNVKWKDLNYYLAKIEKIGEFSFLLLILFYLS